VIRVITIEREYGCGAAGIARELAARLGWKLWDQVLTEEIAGLAHCEQSEVKQREERKDPLYYRLLKSFVLGSYEGNSSVQPVETLDADSAFFSMDPGKKKYAAWSPKARVRQRQRC